MQVDGVRIYHDQALYKEPGGGCTPWHADGYYFPLDTEKILTAWVPLQPVPKIMVFPLQLLNGKRLRAPAALCTNL